MNKTGIKSISTPNKKYERLLEKNFLTIKIDEYNTSIIENKTEKRCENLIITEKSYEKMGIKSIYSLERLRMKNNEEYEKKMKNIKIHKILTCFTSSKYVKYINRDNNAVKNMLKIVSLYIKENKKPITYVRGTKICNGAQRVI